jgi:hypothetical protein
MPIVMMADRVLIQTSVVSLIGSRTVGLPARTNTIHDQHFTKTGVRASFVS